MVNRRRAKFIVISELTSDFLDTTGVLSKIEGELEDGADLSSIVQHAKEAVFEWDVSGSISNATSYESQVHHPNFHPFTEYDDSFHQPFKSYYSVQCVIDGTCPINIKDQINDMR